MASNQLGNSWLLSTISSTRSCGKGTSVLVNLLLLSHLGEVPVLLVEEGSGQTKVAHSASSPDSKIEWF